MSVKEALEKIRREGKDKETIYLMPVIDHQRKLLGVVTLEDLIFADPDTLVEQVMDDQPVYVYATTDQEEVAQIMRKYDLVAVPVVDSEQRLIGIITIDDVVDVIDEEATEDILKMSSIVVTEQSYFHTSSWQFFINRLPWLVALLLLGTLSSGIIAKFETLLASLPIIAAFMPAMVDTGGNIGSQISALVIRGMALKEIKQKDWWRILLRELLIGAMLGIVLALAVVLRAVFVTRTTQVILAVSTALFAVVVASNIIGALLPFIAKSLKIDPAIMAGPLLTTIVDLLGIAIYFSIANFMFSV